LWIFHQELNGRLSDVNAFIHFQFPTYSVNLHTWEVCYTNAELYVHGSILNNPTQSNPAFNEDDDNNIDNDGYIYVPIYHKTLTSVFV